MISFRVLHLFHVIAIGGDALERRADLAVELVLLIAANIRVADGVQRQLVRAGGGRHKLSSQNATNKLRIVDDTNPHEQHKPVAAHEQFCPT
jgi:hypothetical protein